MRRIAATAVAIFLAVQIVAAITHRSLVIPGETDAARYLTYAAGPLVRADSRLPIGFPWTIRFVSAATSMSPFASGKTVCVVSGCAFLVLSYLLAMRLTQNEKTASYAVLFLAASPLVHSLSVRILSDMLAATLCLGAILAMPTRWRPGRETVRLAAFSGALAAAAFLTRHVYLVLGALPVFVFWRNGRALLAFYVAFFAVAAVWLVPVSFATETPFWSHYVRNAEYGLRAFPSGRAYGVDAPSSWTALALGGGGLSLIKQYVHNALAIPMRCATEIHGGALAAVGLLLMVKRLDRPAALALGAMTLYGLAISAAWPGARFLLPLMPLVAVSMAVALESVGGATARVAATAVVVVNLFHTQHWLREFLGRSGM